MTDQQNKAWDDYWQKATAAGFQHKEAEHAVIEQFWHQFFTVQFKQHPARVILELACGKGAVSGLARQCLNTLSEPEKTGQDATPHVEHYCLDYSFAAAKATASTLNLRGAIVADGARLPLRDASVDMLFSQFGMEYAGPHALIQATQALRKGGVLVAVIHHRDGLIYQHSERSVSALYEVLQSDIFELAAQAFDAGFALIKGQGSEQAFQQADRAMSTPVQQITALLKTRGPQVADGIVMQFYRDLGEMFNQMHHYEANDVRQWLHNMKQEMLTHRQRMQSMLDAAYDQQAIQYLVETLSNTGLNIEQCDTISSAEGLLAWRLVARA
ncbi:class I SAM-dependent methyltransferase [Lacimicrobium sp. SS2-24]|uniref:class I SAM-dependent methyltransferase n=1 Tax=Lacimicrobium sp. SS2-24 TaxID=2005569 RepID=UPI000B4ABB57|nr:class I SAM-dependent methyltransferase [Lacimicrobium sp. SS2-24]